jgi:hypothetical protein
MTTEVAIQDGMRYALSSDPEMDAIAHLEQMAGMGLNAFGFRIDKRVIFLEGDSLQTVIVEACEIEN